MIAITGATGHLGRHVVAELLKKVPASQIIVAVRTPEKAKADFGACGSRRRFARNYVMASPPIGVFKSTQR
jgi:NAD(P)H dehydrogenase (quinone)